MRSNISHYELKTPRNLQEGLKWLQEAPGKWVPFAGGTDLMVLYEAGVLKHRQFLNLWGLPELKGIRTTPEQIELGALTTYDEIRENPILQKEFPNLCQAAAVTGAISIQNRGTLGGNIANASPAADSPPALLTYDAELELTSQKGSRWIDYSHFHLDYKKTALASGEII